MTIRMWLLVLPVQMFVLLADSILLVLVLVLIRVTSVTSTNTNDN